MIYLDYAATTPISTEVREIVYQSMKDDWCNPSSSYYNAVKVKNKIEDVRTTIANYINCDKDEIIFTSSGSESNNLAIKGFLEANRKHILVIDPISHSSVINIRKKRVLLDINRNGLILHSFLADKLERVQKIYHSQALVSINGGNNEIGTIQNISKISKIVHSFGGILHVDAVQLFPVQRIDVKALGIDMMSVSGHKFGCPKGIGFLYKRKGIQLNALISGEQEKTLRGGTENIPYIIGLGEAILQLSKSDLHQRTKSLIEKRNYFIEQLESLGNTYLVGSSHRLPNNINMCFKGIETSTLLTYLDTYDISASAGSACNSQSIKPSHVISALSLPKEDEYCCIRFTIDNETTKDEIDQTVKIIKNFKSRLN